EAGGATSKPLRKREHPSTHRPGPIAEISVSADGSGMGFSHRVLISTSVSRHTDDPCSSTIVLLAPSTLPRPAAWTTAEREKSLSLSNTALRSRIFLYPTEKDPSLSIRARAAVAIVCPR